MIFNLGRQAPVAAHTAAKDGTTFWLNVVGVDASCASNCMLFRVLEWGGMEVEWVWVMSRKRWRFGPFFSSSFPSGYAFTSLNVLNIFRSCMFIYLVGWSIVLADCLYSCIFGCPCIRLGSLTLRLFLNREFSKSKLRKFDLPWRTLCTYHWIK
jgi:hypothetical protein